MCFRTFRLGQERAHSHPSRGRATPASAPQLRAVPQGPAGAPASPWLGVRREVGVRGTEAHWLLPVGLAGRGGPRGLAMSPRVPWEQGATPGLIHRAETPGRSTHSLTRGPVDLTVL